MGNIAKALGRDWKTLSDNKRKNYEDKSKTDKERYEMEMNWLVTMGYSLNDNRYELDAESFGRENWKMWKKELV